MAGSHTGEITSLDVHQEVWDRAARIDGEGAEIGLRPATEAELLAGMLCVDQALMREAEIVRATENVAKEIIRDEYARFLEEGADYRQPVMVGLLNGGVPFAVELAQTMARYVVPTPDGGKPFHLDLDIVFVNPSMYEEQMQPGDPTFEKGYTSRELLRLSGRHHIIADDGSDLGGTIEFAEEVTSDSLQGTAPRKVKDEDGNTVGFEDVQLEQALSVRKAILWLKPESTAVVDYVGVHIDRPWINGFGCNSELDDGSGDSVGRNVRLIAETVAQP